MPQWTEQRVTITYINISVVGPIESIFDHSILQEEILNFPFSNTINNYLLIGQAEYPLYIMAIPLQNQQTRSPTMKCVFPITIQLVCLKNLKTSIRMEASGISRLHNFRCRQGNKENWRETEHILPKSAGHLHEQKLQLSSSNSSTISFRSCAKEVNDM